MDTELGRIRLSEQIEEAILKAIRAGEFPPGTKLPSERQLMEMFDVGRPSVKEALLMLERKGFLRLQRGIAPVVVEPTPESAMQAIGDMVQAMLPDTTRRSDFYDLRIMLETSAVMDAARQPNPEDLARIEAALDACAAAAGRAAAFREADVAFHRQLMAAQGNAVAGALHAALLEWGLYHPEEGPERRAIHARVVSQHRAIVEAIRSGDPLAAADAVRAHLMTRRDQPQSN
ncbi:FadR/GntR family transcriptional regulator [Jannaschia aquimarina]|uniref:FadR_2 protein n=1 Tax=Jannaschia aquimarina TaxID=935700 RepID=A0A0D1EGQ3_9RHOB|nr:FCD domain-containing protein [Jannaschia aquimarina]KIT15030.1 Fatty acid metabolism regulator protein [Jannaschia aquimarina]SNS62335.1 transcriptional regulator, GntR family [Jannaschia aquimarina]